MRIWKRAKNEKVEKDEKRGVFETFEKNVSKKTDEYLSFERRCVKGPFSLENVLLAVSECASSEWFLPFFGEGKTLCVLFECPTWVRFNIVALSFFTISRVSTVSLSIFPTSLSDSSRKRPSSVAWPLVLKRGKMRARSFKNVLFDELGLPFVKIPIRTF